jgi:hypothetical protein
MGFIKELSIQGIHYIEKAVCDKCFDDYAIKKFIKGNASTKKCDYCGKSSRDINSAVPLHEVVEFMLDGINYEWDIPGNSVTWCSQEGGWVGARVIHKYDLVADELELEIQDNDLFNDIVHSIADDEWCQRDPYGLPPGEEMFYDWEKFSEQIKHQIRYVFFRAKRRGERDVLERHEPYFILNRLGQVVNELSLIDSLPLGTEFIRARVSKKRLHPVVKELGPPLPQEAIYSNRMSPAGIPMFYGSIDEKTAIAETYDKKDKSKRYVTVATFKTMRELTILDLTKLPEFPSLFDENRRHIRGPLSFLRSFVADFSKSIKKDGREHIEYVPTQVVTEYFRHIFRYERRRSIDGIIYPSSRKKKGKSCVLFCGRQNCVQDNSASGEDNDKWLIMISSSVKNIKLK